MYTEKDCLVLFDMDGTLTEARKKADWSMVRPLRDLSNYAHIGIVTGSPMSYLKQQCSILWSDLGSVNIDCITLFPCNGTQSYNFSTEEKKWIANSSINMRDHIGDIRCHKIIREILSIQSGYADTHHELPLTGNFVSDRKSMINWCPVGRDADDKARLEFSKFDKKYNCRLTLKKDLEDALDYLDIPAVTCVLGGNTSIDIYPKGWDKTYVLRHIEDYKTVYFVGDRCTGYGNDRTLYEALEPGVTSFSTDSPSNTISIIKSITTKLGKESNE